MRFPAFLSYFLALVFGVVIAATAARADWPLEAMNKQIEQTNVIVGGNCSGTVIDVEKRLVLTANHCVDGNMVERKVKTVDPKTGEVSEKTVLEKAPVFVTVRKVLNYEVVGTSSQLTRIIGADKKTDVAILQVIDPDYKPAMAAPLAKDDFNYQRGATVYAVGNPAVEYDASISQGIISAPQRTVDFGTGEKLKMFQHTASTIGGNSGGAIYNDAGEIIGTVTGGLSKGLVGFAAPISLTKQLLISSGFPEVAKGTQ